MASDEELAPWLCTLVPAPAKLLGLHRLVSCMHLDLENLFFKDVNAGFGLPCLRTHSAGVAEVCPPVLSRSAEGEPLGGAGTAGCCAAAAFHGGRGGKERRPGMFSGRFRLRSATLAAAIAAAAVRHKASSPRPAGGSDRATVGTQLNAASVRYEASPLEHGRRAVWTR